MKPSTEALAILTTVFAALWFAGPAKAGWTAAEQPDLTVEIEQAPPLEVETLSQPTETVRFEAPVVVPDLDSETVDVLVIYYRSYTGPATVFAVDTATGGVTRCEVPEGRNVHLQAMPLGPNGKLYATLQRVGGGLELWVYDPATNRFEAKTTFGKDLDLMGQNNLLTLAPDGRLYGTVGSRASGEAAFYRIDPADDAVEILGTGGDLRGSGYAGAIAVSGGKLYAVYGKTPYKLIEFDPAAKSSRVLATANPRGGISIRRLPDQEELSVTIRVAESGVAKDGTYAIHQGRLTWAAAAREKAPAGTAGGNAAPGELKSKGPPGGSLRHRLVELDASRLDPFLNADGRGLLCYRLPQEAEWTEVKLDPPTWPEAITQLVALPDGRIFGSAANRAGHFVFDPASGKTTFLGRTGLQHHSTAVSGNSVFLSGYPSSLVWEYDFTKPWEPYLAKTKEDTLGGVILDRNPRPLGTLREHSGVHMATSAAADSEGRVYFAGRWYRDGQGGGVGWWNPTVQVAGGFWEELSNLQVVDCKAVDDGRYVVLSTLAVADPVLKKETPDTAQLCVLDTAADVNVIAKRILPVAGVRSTGLIAPAGGTRLIGIAPSSEGNAAWLMYGVDVQSGRVAFLKSLPGIPEDGKLASAELLHTYRSQLVNAPDGSIWMKHLGVLLRIDPASGHVTVVGRPPRGPEATEGAGEAGSEDRRTIDSLQLIKAVGAPATVGSMAFSGQDVYLGGTPSLWRIRGILAQERPRHY